MNTAVERTAVDAVDWGGERNEVRGELVRLVDAFSCKGRVGGDSCGGGDRGGVCSCFGVDDLRDEVLVSARNRKGGG